MKTILVRFYNPKKVMDITPETLEVEIKEWCFRVDKYDSETNALRAYEYAKNANTWSAILDENTDVGKWIDKAWNRIKHHDYKWFKENFRYNNDIKFHLGLWIKRVMWRLRRS